MVHFSLLVFKSATTQAVSETRQIAQLLLVTPMNAHTQAPGVKAKEAGGGDKRGRINAARHTDTQYINIKLEPIQRIRTIY